MSKDAPDERAQKLADRLTGRASTDNDVMSSIAGNVSVGQRGEDGKPIGNKVSAEEFVSTRRAKSDRDATVDDDDEEDELDEGGEEESEEEDQDDDDAFDPDEEEGDAEEESDDDEEDDGEDYGVTDYDDEDTLKVKVDGEFVEVSLRELKRVYSLNEATEKRLKEATETQKAAKAEREQVQVEIQGHRANMLRTIQKLDSVLFAPLINPPDPKLRTKNINEYLLHKDAYEEDQRRITLSRQQLTQFLAKEHGDMENARAEYRQTQQALLVEKMPELLDPTKNEKLQREIMEAAAYYGVTPEMVAQVDHHALFVMARDAARWLNMQKLKKTGKVPTDGEENRIKRRKRHLKAGNGSASTKQALVKSQRDQRTATAQARKTGSVNDVTNMLISKARKRVIPNGRSGKNV